MTRPLGNRTDAVGNGTTPDYDYTFIIEDETHLLVTVRSPLGVESTLTLTTDYTVSGVGDVGGGRISLVDDGQLWLDDDGNLEDGWHITTRRKRPLTQETDIRNQGDFYPEAHEDQFDALVDIDQQQQDELDRSAKMPETVAASAFNPELPASLPDNPGAVIIVNDAGDGFDVGPTADEISGAQAASIAAQAAQAGAEEAEDAAVIAKNAAEAAAGSMTLASQAEAEAGTDNTKYMSALRVKQAIKKHKVIVATVAIADGELDIDASLCDVAEVECDADFTLNAPTNGVNGDRLEIRFTQDGTGSRVLTLGTGFLISSELAEEGIVLSTAANAFDKLGMSFDGTNWMIDAFSSDYAEPE